MEFLLFLFLQRRILHQQVLFWFLGLPFFQFFILFWCQYCPKVWKILENRFYYFYPYLLVPLTLFFIFQLNLKYGYNCLGLWWTLHERADYQDSHRILQKFLYRLLTYQHIGFGQNFLTRSWRFLTRSVMQDRIDHRAYFIFRIRL